MDNEQDAKKAKELKHQKELKVADACNKLYAVLHDRNDVDSILLTRNQIADLLKLTWEAWNEGEHKEDWHILLQTSVDIMMEECREIYPGREIKAPKRPWRFPPMERSFWSVYTCPDCSKQGVKPTEQTLLVGASQYGLQLWCPRHDCNVMHINLEGIRHPGTGHATDFPKDIELMTEPDDDYQELESEDGRQQSWRLWLVAPAEAGGDPSFMVNKDWEDPVKNGMVIATYCAWTLKEAKYIGHMLAAIYQTRMKQEQ